MVNYAPIVTYLDHELLPRFAQIVITPWLNKELLWMVIPLILIIFLVQAYFGRNRTEELGWNTAFGNAISLFWISVILARFVIESTPLDQLLQGKAVKSLILIAVLFFWTVLLIVSDFFHALPKKVAFFLSSEIPINITAYLFIVLIAGNIPLDKTTLLAGITLLVYAIIFFALFRTIITPSEVAKRVLNFRRNKKREEKQRRKEQRREKVQQWKEKVVTSLDVLKGRKPKV